MALSDEDDKVPKDTGAGFVAKVVREVINEIPIARIPGKVIFDRLVTPHLEDRKNAWLEGLAARLKELETRFGILPQTLATNDKFIDAVLFATQAAIRTSEPEKLSALRNAAVNAALPNSPDLFVQQIFLSSIERLSSEHIRVLRFAQDTRQFRTVTGQDLPRSDQATALLEAAFPYSVSQPELYKLIWDDLFGMGLVKLSKLDNGYEGDGRGMKRTTDFGDRFLNFITDPLKGK